MNRDTYKLVNDGTSTFLDIAQMTQYRMKYLQDRDEEAKEKMIKYSVLAGLGILSLLTIGLLGLVGSRPKGLRGPTIGGLNHLRNLNR